MANFFIEGRATGNHILKMSTKSLVYFSKYFLPEFAVFGFQHQPEQRPSNRAFINFCLDAAVHEFVQTRNTKKNADLVISKSFHQIG